MTTKLYILPFREKARLHQRAYRAQQRDHSEVCGVLLTADERKLQLYFLPNRSERCAAWLLHGTDIVAARREARSLGLRVVGTFHSHPFTEPVPGERDLASIWRGSMQLIYDVCGRAARLWTVASQNGQIVPRELCLSIEPKSAGQSQRPAE